ncbi:hypothetical protein TNCV_3179561 [Trichonephila clavipes]|nr:hypothetical protein TNCV_3179561 [Trichonephila clavipes]
MTTVFRCQTSRPGSRAVGVAIYRKCNNSHVVNPHIDITHRQIRGEGIVSQDLVHLYFRSKSPITTEARSEAKGL